MTAQTDPASVTEIAAKLTPLMVMLVDTLDWDQWFSADDADASGATCNALVKHGLLERRSDPYTSGRSQYRRTVFAIPLRAHLQKGTK